MITDHAHEYQAIHPGSPWRSRYCGVCQQPLTSHYSWGLAIAAKVGGDPLDYVDRDSK